MYFLARKNLLQDKTRFIISVGGVAFSVLLMILLQGLNIGFSNVLGQYFTNVPADLWVAKANTGNIMDPSFLPLSVGPKLRTVEGVASAEPYGMQSLTTTHRDKNLEFYLISYDPAQPIGKPTSISEGKEVPAPGEIIIDRIVASSNHIQLGESLEFGGKRLKVVGFSEGTFLLSSSFAFVNIKDASGAYGLPSTTNYWVVRINPGASVTSVQSAINRQIPGVYAHTKAHFIKENVDVVKSIVEPVFSALVVLGAAIGTVVTGLTIFTATIEKSKEYGVLKAIGLRNGQLYRIVLEQAVLIAAIGSVVGTLLAYILNPFITNAVPQFVTQLRVIDVIWVTGATVIMAILSSYIPIRRLSKLDPAEVFRS